MNVAFFLRLVEDGIFFLHRSTGHLFVAVEWRCIYFLHFDLPIDFKPGGKVAYVGTSFLFVDILSYFAQNNLQMCLSEQAP